jgi:hypothetical protein
MEDVTQVLRIRDIHRAMAGPLGYQDVVQEEDDPLVQVAAMSVQEIREQLPLAQDHLEAIESGLEELMDQRDVSVILIAAMQARLDALTEAELDEKVASR